jgi:ribosomal protein L37AE/L43A
MSKHDVRRRLMASGARLGQAYHCDACDPTHIVAAYPVTHIRNGKRLCGECAEEHDRRDRELAAPLVGRCHTCSRNDHLSRTIGDLWQCSECVTAEARQRSEQRQ